MRTKVAIGLLVAAAAIYVATARTPATPLPAGAIDLTTAFVGPDAAKDASTVAGMSDAIAGMIEWDGTQSEPILKTGKSLDQLRTRTRQFLCGGESLGQKHPKVGELVGAYLTDKLGESGGEITPEQRDAWVAAYREIARSARHAIGR